MIVLLIAFCLGLGWFAGALTVIARLVMDGWVLKTDEGRKLGEGRYILYRKDS